MPTSESKSNGRSSQQSPINLQQYHINNKFKQPQYLDSHDDQSEGSLVDQFEQTPKKCNSSKKESQIGINQNNTQSYNRQSYQEIEKNNRAFSKSSSKQKNAQREAGRSSLSEKEQQSSRNHLILQFKVNQLQKICTTLTSANEKLLDKIQQLQEQNESYKKKIALLQQEKEEQLSRQHKYQSSRSGEDYESDELLSKQSDKRGQNSEPHEEQESKEQLTLQEDVVDIEEMIKEYREELKKAEEINNNSKQQYEKRISELQSQLNQLNSHLGEVQNINQQLQLQLSELEKRNQALELEIQQITNYYQDDSSLHNPAESRSTQYHTIGPSYSRNIKDNRQYSKNTINFYEDDFSHSSQQSLNPFDSSVQLELQRLIQKLVKELQYERGIKKRMNDEIKRIQRELLESEKQIMFKNKKIYELEISMIKGEKEYLFGGSISNYSREIDPQPKKQINRSRLVTSPRDESLRKSFLNCNSLVRDNTPGDRQRYVQQQNSQQINQSSYSPLSKQMQKSSSIYLSQKAPSNHNNQHSKLLQTFSLSQLINDPSIILSIKQKIHIATKLVQFYEQKIYQQKNFKLLMLDNVLVTNFNRINLRLIKIRAEDTRARLKTIPNRKDHNSDDMAEEPEQLIRNLGFLLDSLFIEAPTKEQDFGHLQAERKILDQIQIILDNRNLSLQNLVALKSLFDEALAQRQNQ